MKVDRYITIFMNGVLKNGSTDIFAPLSPRRFRGYMFGKARMSTMLLGQDDKGIIFDDARQCVKKIRDVNCFYIEKCKIIQKKKVAASHCE